MHQNYYYFLIQLSNKNQLLGYQNYIQVYAQKRFHRKLL